MFYILIEDIVVTANNMPAVFFHKIITDELLWI